MIPDFIVNSPVRIMIGEFLNIVLIDNSFIFINMWSVVHFFSGLLVFLFFLKILKVGKGMSFLYTFIALVSYEFLEYYAINVWWPDYWIFETNIDIIYDIIVGMFGGFVGSLIFNKKS